MSTVSSAISLAITTLIKPFEGYHKKLPDGGCKAYPDPGTNGAPWTIGYGSTGKDITKDTVWTLEQAEAHLTEHIQYFAANLLKISPVLATVETRRFAAIISFAYNCGLGNYRISTLRKKVEEKNWTEAAEQILKWNKAAGRVLPGLTRRRKAESLMLL